MATVSALLIRTKIQFTKPKLDRTILVLAITIYCLVKYDVTYIPCSLNICALVSERCLNTYRHITNRLCVLCVHSTNILHYVCAYT